MDEASALALLCQLKNEAPNKVSKAVYIKRTNGKFRRIVFDFQLASLTKGTGPSKIFGGRGIVVVRDVRKNQIRSIPIDSLLSIDRKRVVRK